MERNRSIPWKMRPDLIVNLSQDGSQVQWTVKDPVTLEYFSLSEEEYHCLSSLDGSRSFADVVKFLPSKSGSISDQEFVSFLNKLIVNNLVVSTNLGYGQLVSQRASRKRGNPAKGLARFNLISFRWRGIDPQRLLVGLNSMLGWIYSPYALMFSFVLLAFAGIALLTRSLDPEFSQLSVQPIFTFQNLPLLIASILVVKIIHEFAHGLTCVHYGGECHELGVLFIVFFPLLYCDTTDSWLKQNRWQRAQVAGAGMFVELVIASVCCLLWVNSVPGLLHSVFLNLMLVCSLNTLLVNGNPLLRYDGYYLLSDVLNMPNLGPDSRYLTQSWFDRIVYGTRLPPETQVSLKHFGMTLYGVASSLYRIVVFVVIGWSVHQMLKHAGLGELTLLVLAPMILGLMIGVIFAAIRRGRSLVGETSVMKRLRALFGISVLAGLLTFLLMIPLPHTIAVPFSFEPSACRPIYVTVPGQLKEIRTDQGSLDEGDLIAELENPSLTLAVRKTESELELQELHLDNLNKFRSSSASMSASIPEAAKAVEITRQRLEAERRMLARLKLKSPTPGTFYPSRNFPETDRNNAGVQFWSGHPLQPENRSAWLNEQTILGWVGNEEDLRVVAYVPQDQMEFIRQDAKARVVFQSAPDDICPAHVTEVGTERVDVLTRELVSNQFAAVDPLGGQLQPLKTFYRVRLKIDSGQVGGLYSTGFVKIEGAPKSIATRLWRLISHTFAIDA